jgi:hypothetical protein
MTVKVIQFEGYFRRAFEKRIKDGLIYKKALGHIGMMRTGFFLCDLEASLATTA